MLDLIEKVLLLSLSLLLDIDDVRLTGEAPRLTVSAPKSLHMNMNMNKWSNLWQYKSNELPVYVLLADPEPELVEVDGELLSGEGVPSCCCCDRSCAIESAESLADV